MSKKLRLFPKNIFTFIDKDGVNVHIDSEGLRQWCLKTNPEIFSLPLNYTLAHEMLRDNVVSLERVRELITRKVRLDPIIMVKDGTIGSNGHPNAMLVDGHHRFFIACASGWSHIEGYFLEYSEWKPFQIHGLPSVTREQLKASPITKRNY